MDKTNEFEKHISDFISFMQVKGYRQKFMMDRLMVSGILTTGTLRKCLEDYLSLRKTDTEYKNTVVLETYANYKKPGDYINCVFSIEFDERKGFLITSVEAKKNSRSGETKQFKMISNRQLPDCRALKRLFITKGQENGHPKRKWGL